MVRKPPSQWKFKLPADLCKLHLAWACYKLGSLFSLWCQQNGGCQEVQGLGNVSHQGWSSPLSRSCAHGTDGEEPGTCKLIDKSAIMGKGRLLVTQKIRNCSLIYVCPETDMTYLYIKKTMFLGDKHTVGQIDNWFKLKIDLVDQSRSFGPARSIFSCPDCEHGAPVAVAPARRDSDKRRHSTTHAVGKISKLSAHHRCAKKKQEWGLFLRSESRMLFCGFARLGCWTCCRNAQGCLFRTRHFRVMFTAVGPKCGAVAGIWSF